MVVGMGFIERRPGENGYRARYRDPLGRQHSRTFARKADAQRFLLEMEADKARGAWPHGYRTGRQMTCRLNPRRAPLGGGPPFTGEEAWFAAGQ